MRLWRWAVVAGLVSVLAAAPSMAGALPVDDAELSAEQLLQRVRASDQIAWSGYGTSRGTLVVPDVRELSDLPGLVGETTRARAWWRGPDSWRVDALSLVGETGTIRDPTGTWTWMSADNRALRVFGDLDVRLPAAADLLAPVLGHRLAGTGEVTLSRLDPRRVAGRSTSGLRLTPRDPARTTVRAVDLWADPATGLVLRVEVRTSDDAPALTSTLLDLDLSAPDPVRTAFSPPDDAAVTGTDAPDLAALADRYAPYDLPGTLAGLPRRARSVLSTDGGVGTYGDGLSSVALVPLTRELADDLIRRVDPDDDDRTAILRTPLVNAVVGRQGRNRGYLLVGTVPASVLQSALAQLRVSPPPRVDR